LAAVPDAPHLVLDGRLTTVRWNKTLAVLGAGALLVGLLVGVGLAAGSTPESPGPNPPLGYYVGEVTYDAQGRPMYTYVRIGEELTPPAEEDKQSVLRAQAFQVYRDALRARLEAETPYRYSQLAPGAKGDPAPLPVQMESVFVHVFVERPQIVTAMRDILPVVLSYDSTLNRVGFIFQVPTAMYAEAGVYVSEVADIDWDKAAQELEQGETFVRLASQGHIAIY
jgi:hypothetical protein